MVGESAGRARLGSNPIMPSMPSLLSASRDRVSGGHVLPMARRRLEDSLERVFPRSGSIDDQWGRSESLDPDNVGDIADEGIGHRG